VDALTQSGPTQCPNCHKDLFPDQVTSDSNLRKEVDDYVRAYAAKRKEALRSQSTGRSGSVTESGDEHDAEPKNMPLESSDTESKGRAASGTRAPASTGVGKSVAGTKRSLDASEGGYGDKRIKAYESGSNDDNGASRIIPVVSFTDREQMVYIHCTCL
jgi:hypothetical protein